MKVVFERICKLREAANVVFMHYNPYQTEDWKYPILKKLEEALYDASEAEIEKLQMQVEQLNKVRLLAEEFYENSNLQVWDDRLGEALRDWKKIEG